MSFYLTSICSSISGQTALGVFDESGEFKYTQVIKNDFLKNHSFYRSLVFHNGKVYALSKTEIHIYTIATNAEADFFQYQSSISCNEWQLGGKSKANLLTMLVSKNNHIYVGCNGLASIDEFGPEGNFLSRTHLWEFIDDNEYSHYRNESINPYGLIRSIKEVDGEIFLTIAYPDKKRASGLLVNFSKKTVLGKLDFIPETIDCVNNNLIIASAKKKKLFYFDLINEELNELSLVSTFQRNSYNVVTGGSALKGIAASNETCFIGCTDFRSVNKEFSQSYLLKVDTNTGEIIFVKDVADIMNMESPWIQATTRVSNNDDFSSSFRNFLVSNAGNVIEHDEPEELESTADQRKVVVTADNIDLIYQRRGRSWFSDRSLRVNKAIYALKGLSFNIYEGDIVGIIGRNGSGKSTVSMVLSGSLTPDTGSINVDGKVQLLSLGVGFRTELTGRDNIYINGALLGLSKKQIIDKIDSIVDFSELKEYIDEPISTYSAGMKSRLAFAVATAVEPDVLILDEVLSTGDQSFRLKAEQRMTDLRNNAKTVVMISHNSGQIKKMCNRCIWIEKGKLIMEGSSRKVVAEYEKFCRDPDSWLEKNGISFD